MPYIYLAAYLLTIETTSLQSFNEMGKIILKTISALNVFARSVIWRAISSLIRHFFWSRYSNTNTSNRFSLLSCSNTLMNFQRFYIIPNLISSFVSFKIKSRTDSNSFSDLCGPNMCANSCREQARGFFIRLSVFFNSCWNSFDIWGHLLGPNVLRTAGKLKEQTCRIYDIHKLIYLFVDS